MKAILVFAAFAIAACGKDSTAPLDWDHTCDQAKMDLLHELDPNFSPTPQLMQQTQFNLGGTTWAKFTVVNGACVVTRGSN